MSTLSAADTLAVPVRHRPIVTMGRDCWRVLRKYNPHGNDGKPTIGFDNEELNNSPALSDIAFSYKASKPPPPADIGLAVWPRLGQYFLKLGLAASKAVKDVDFATVWGQGHTMAERTGSSTDNFITWVNDCCK